jgi:hypothetical protein
MKTQNLIISALIIFLIALFACDKNSPDDSYRPVKFNFTLIDSLGNDLFFDENSPYDPYGVEIDTTTFSYKGWSVKDSCCFRIGGFYIANRPKEQIHIKFFPGRTDTITIEEQEYAEGEQPYDYNIEFNAYFNSDTVCFKCYESNIIFHEITTDIPSKKPPK